MQLCLLGSAKVVCIAKVVSIIYHVIMIGLQVKLAIIGVQAAGVGLDFSAAQSVAFVELPKSASVMLQVLAS